MLDFEWAKVRKKRKPGGINDEMNRWKSLEFNGQVQVINL